MRPYRTLLKRGDFVAATKTGEKLAAPSLVMQIRDRGDDAPARVGFTATRKIGNAVIRNRAKRRLRAVTGEILARHLRPGHDYVLIARYSTASNPWQKICDDCAGIMRRYEKAMAKKEAGQ